MTLTAFPAIALLTVLHTSGAAWNIIVARIFPLDRTRAASISRQTIIDRACGGMLILPGTRVAVP